MNHDGRQVEILEEGSAPRLIHFGEGFLLEKLPPGTRVIYPNPPMKGLANVDAAIRYAISHPEGSEPLWALLKPGMKLTIAVDDISIPLPPMKTPDVRQRMLEIVLEQCAQYGVEDIEIVVAIAVHRKMSADEIKRMVGGKIFAEYWPDRLYNHDAEEPGNMVEIGRTEAEEVVTLPRRVVESDLVIYCNVNLVPMDGGHKSVAVGLADVRSLKAHHNPQTIRKTHSYMDPERAYMHESVNRQGRLVDSKLKVFHLEAALNTRMFGEPMGFLAKREEEWTRGDWTKMDLMRYALERTPRAAKRAMFHAIPAAYDVIAVNAGATEPTHKRTLKANLDQYVVPVKGQADVLVSGVPYISPYNVNSILNPLLVQVVGMGYFYNMFVGPKPLLRDGGVLILLHPMPDEFHPDHHPSYIEFFHRVLADTRDALEIHKKYEAEFANNPAYIQMYRRGNAYHGVHPFYMWYWGENCRQKVGRVIAVGAESDAVPERMGWESAPTLTDALERAKDIVGRSPQITMMHHPPLVVAQVE
jgi:hypothetical protein